jgi:adenine-specific DNA-methyltransferase
MPILDWLNKGEAVKTARHVPYRLLQGVKSLSYGDADTENMLIQGDNLEALKALLPLYAGKVKCIYIDPPYNTKSAFEHYDDNLEHSQWLCMMYPRLELLRELLSEDGSIWVSIDDNEAHYLKVMMDEIFGRKNFVTNVVWQKRTSPDNRLRLGDAHDHILVFRKNKISGNEAFKQLPISDERSKDFKNPDNDSRGPWASTDFTGMTGHATPSQFYTIISPTGIAHPPPDGRCWALAEDTFKKLLADNRVWFGKDGNARPRLKRFLMEMEGQNSWSWWPNTEVGHNQESKKEIVALFGASSAFGTPKPERLLYRILHIATNEGDLVLDSFLGSGTTAAVAHKMKRRYIGIEMGEHAETHCQPRLKKVVDGEQGGISESVEWQGGGGFHFYRLGPTVFDEFGAIRPDIRFAELAAHVWYLETHTPWISPHPNPLPRGERGEKLSPLLGAHNGTAYYLLYNGILGDRRPQGGNVLTGPVLAELPQHDGPKVIYGESSRLGAARLQGESITFKQIPYDVRTR